jgi:hypothetical protein
MRDSAVIQLFPDLRSTSPVERIDLREVGRMGTTRLCVLRSAGSRQRGR